MVRGWGHGSAGMRGDGLKLQMWGGNGDAFLSPSHSASKAFDPVKLIPNSVYPVVYHIVLVNLCSTMYRITTRWWPVLYVQKFKTVEFC